MGDQRTRTGSLREHAAETDTDPLTVVHELTPDAAEPDLHRISWLAAYTVGLSFTRADDRTCVDQLLDIHARECELRGAHGMLAAWDMVDAARHRRALDLLERALSRMGADVPRPSATPEHRWVTEWSH